MATIFWASDSSVATKNYKYYPQQGIGQVFGLFVKSEYPIENYAHGGRSSKSFLSEGRLAPIEEKIKEGDFLFIQFGGNDIKDYDPHRYTEPYTTFIECLEVYINTARAHGAYPVLITSMERRCFDDEGRLGESTYFDYVEGMKQAAEKNQVPLVDLNTACRNKLREAGPEKSKDWYMCFPPNRYPGWPEGRDDRNHLRHEGAVVFASLIAKGLKELGGIYADIILDDIQLD